MSSGERIREPSLSWGWSEDRQPAIRAPEPGEAGAGEKAALTWVSGPALALFGEPGGLTRLALGQPCVLLTSHPQAPATLLWERP